MLGMIFISESMKRMFFFVCCVCCSISLFPQTKGYVGAFLDWEYEYPIPVYDKPDGMIIGYLENDLEEEFFVNLRIYEKKGNMFRVTARLDFWGEQKLSGWIDVFESIVLTSRAAQGNLKLYESPSYNSKVRCIVKPYDPGTYSIIDVHGNWAKVKRTLHGKVYVGWMPPEMQCGNAYSTCS